MYDLVLELQDEIDICLMPTQEFIWIGVIEKMNPSPPIPRKRATCFSKRPIYLYNGHRVFSMIKDYKVNEFDFYYIPDEELFFIERSSK